MTTTITSEMVQEYETKRRAAVEAAEDRYEAERVLSEDFTGSELAGIGTCPAGREAEAEELGPDGIGYTSDGYLIAWGPELRINGALYREIVLA